MDTTHPVEKLFEKLIKAEETLGGSSHPGASEAAELLASYRQLVTAFTKFPDPNRRDWVKERGYHVWTRDEVMVFPRFSAKPSSFFGIVDVPSFIEEKTVVVGDAPSEGLEIMDIVPGFGVVGFTLDTYLKDWVKIWEGVTKMNPNKVVRIDL